MSGGKRIALTLIFLVGLPLAGLPLARAAQWHDELDFREQMERVVPSSARSRVPTMPLAELCAVAGAESDPACGPYSPAALLRTGSIIAAAIGLLLFAGIVIAGRAARADRGLLVTLFQPGLRLTISATIGLIVLHTLLALLLLFVLLSLRTNLPPPPGILLPVVLGGIFGCVALLRSLHGTVERARTNVVGDVVERQAAPALWRLVDEVAQRIGALRPDRIVAGFGAGFFVTEAEVGTPGGLLSGRTLFIPLPLSRLLTVDELAAVVGHELGHFRGLDTAYSQMFVPIYRGTRAAMDAIQASAHGGQLIVLLPAFAVLGVFLDAFSRAERHHSRARELQADAAGVEATSPRALASALVKVHAFGPYWAAVAASVHADAFSVRQPHVRGLPAGPEPVPEGWRNLSRLFLEVVRPGATLARLHGLGETRTVHPTDTHPPLATRLAALGLDIDAVAAEALVIEPDVPAASLFADATALEERLTELVRGAATGSQQRPRRPSGRGR